ncbi:hypothetical protein J7E96_28385 [Streptomyces sp. ISL-96]|uniref:hypothetical protein n=1 Tax=Streptomyces sp. ISL-96 TaxID=2819191 RepID=UPI001BE4E6C4|nr:hypothetical protein [Streptomyces sp. ISL-96]MBT2492359.1 hypothetical protein [Streptomyces sp. ISL-96]
MVSDTTEEDTTDAEAPEDERPFRVRDVFQFRRQADPKAGEETADETEPEAPPMPTEPPTIPVARVGRAARDDDHHLPDWWEPNKDITLGAPTDQPCKHPNPYTFRVQETGEVVPHWCPDCKTGLTLDVPDTPKAKPEPTATAPARPSGEPCQHPEPHEVRNKVTGQLLAFWCADCETQLEVPDDYDELADITDEDGDGGEAGEDGQPVDKVPPSIRKRWGQGLRGTGGKSYSRPVYGKDSAERKKALIEVWSGMSRKQRHLLYNGSALGAGFYMGVPQFFTAEVAYLVDTYGSWTDFYVCVWYGVAVGVWVLDYRTRGWFPVFAWLTRIPLVSMIVGALLYGTPAA